MDAGLIFAFREERINETGMAKRPMNVKAEQVGGNSALDIVKLTLALIVLTAGIVAYYWFNGQPTWQRLLMLIAGLVVGGAIGYQTHTGRRLKEFLSESVFELRKVVWPTRPEATQMTLYVFLFVVVMALFLWITDKSLEWVIYGLILDMKH